MSKTLIHVFAFLFSLMSANIISGSAIAQDFSTKTDFTTGTTPYSVSFGDLNGDGKQDMVTANFGANTFSVLLNTTTPGASTPTFSAKTDFVTGAGTYSIAIGDLNGDGKSDIAASNYNETSVSVFINTTTPGASTPTFSAKTDFTTGTNPASVSFSDFNGDGKPDMVVANYGSNTVSVFINTTTPGASTPTFSAKTDFTTGTGPYSVATGDFNGDGKQDIASANYEAASVSVFFNTTTPGASTPTFSSKTDFTSGTNPSTVAIRDLNGDGLLDLAVANYGSNSVSVLINTTAPNASTPTFSSATDFATGSGPYTVTLGDFNRDGKPDMAATNYNINSVSVFLNTTTPGAAIPTFGAVSFYTTGTNPSSVSICDLNGDGKPDMATGNETSNDVSVFMNVMSLGVTPASFSASTDFATGTFPRTVKFGDLNGDGKPDMAVANSVSATISVFLNTTPLGGAAPTFSARTDFAVTNAQALTIVDFNGDGKPDLVTSNSVLLNTTTPGASTPTFSPKTDFTTGAGTNYGTVADVNGDGKPDLVSSNNNVVSISILLNTTPTGASTPTFAPKVDFSILTLCQFVSIGDLNGDGKPDLVAVISSPAQLSVLLNTTPTGSATPTFSSRTDFTTGAQPRQVSICDINGDGKPDLAVTNNTPASISVLLNTTTPGASTPSFSAKTDFTAGTNTWGLFTGDVNGDGKTDLVSSNNFASSISVLLNTTPTGNTTPTFSAKTDFTVGTNPRHVSIGDLNGDGKPEIAATNTGSNNVSVLFNTVSLPLPVELASFTSSVNNNNVTLNWSTVQEQNNNGFEIERNSFGTGWKKIGYAEGHGTTNQSQNYIFKDNSLNTGRYSYRLKQIDYNGNFEYYELSNEVAIGVPNRYLLAQNYPNPFNPVSIINYQLAISSFVSLKVYDLAGKEVASLVNEVKDAGYYSVTFDAKNLSSGTYFYNLSTDKFSDVKKMVVLK
jgi:hypothetical protein